MLLHSMQQRMLPDIVSFRQSPLELQLTGSAETPFFCLHLHFCFYILAYIGPSDMMLFRMTFISKTCTCKFELLWSVISSGSVHEVIAWCCAVCCAK